MGNKPSISHEQEIKLIADGDINGLSVMLPDCPELINAEDDAGVTMLMVASTFGAVDVVNLLLEKGATINGIHDKNGESALMKAIKYPNIMSLLLEKGADVNARRKDGSSVLMVACSLGLVDVLSLLLDRGADTSIADEKGRTALHLACANGHRTTARVLLERGGVDKNAQDNDGCTPLMAACGNGKMTLIKLLLEHWVDCNLRDNEGETVLSRAFVEGETDLIVVLLEAGADTNLQYKNGDTLFIKACREGNQIFVDMLLSHAWTNVNMQNDEGETALMAYLRRPGPAHPKMTFIKHMCERNVDLNLQTKDGKTAFSCAVLGRGLEDVGIALIKNGAIVSNQDRLQTLTRFSSLGKRELISLLITTFEPVRSLIGLREDGTADNDHDYGDDGDNGVGANPLKTGFVRDDAGTQFWRKVLVQVREDYSDELSVVLVKWRKYILAVLATADPPKSVKTIGDYVKPAYTTLIVESGLLLRRFEFIQDVDCTEHQDDYVTAGSAVTSHEIPSSAIRHISELSTIFLAKDTKENNRLVALKFVRNRSDFSRELNIRSSCDLDERYVLKLLTYFDADEDEAFLLEAEQKGLHKYCLVFPAADKSLTEQLQHEHIAAREWSKIAKITKQIVDIIVYLHKQGIMHGNIKPSNFVYYKKKLLIIDFSASSRFLDVQTTSSHVSNTLCMSTAFIPPEMLYLAPEESPPPGRSSFSVFGGVPMSPLSNDMPSPLSDRMSRRQVLVRENVRVSRSSVPSAAGTSGGQNTVLAYIQPADPSHDMWSLGVLLFALFSGESLLPANVEGNLSQEMLWQLYNWSEEARDARLSAIVNVTAKNLISRLLSRDPRQRPDAPRVLTHPFLSSKKVVRLVGETPLFDVFIAYRHESEDPVDYLVAEALCSRLTQRGCRVWWDRKGSAKPSPKWEEQMCCALMNAKLFVPIISRDAVKHATDPIQNFEYLKQHSPCDQLLLYIRLAQELKAIGLLEVIFPVLRGDKVDTPIDTLNDPFGTSSYSNYFTSKCHPKHAPDVIVKSVQDKVAYYMDLQGLGPPIDPHVTVRSAMDRLTMKSFQGGLLEGQGLVAVGCVCDAILRILRKGVTTASSLSGYAKAMSREVLRAAPITTEDVTDTPPSVPPAPALAPVPVPVPGTAVCKESSVGRFVYTRPEDMDNVLQELLEEEDDRPEASSRPLFKDLTKINIKKHDSEVVAVAQAMLAQNNGVGVPRSALDSGGPCTPLRGSGKGSVAGSANESEPITPSHRHARRTMSDSPFYSCPTTPMRASDVTPGLTAMMAGPDAPGPSPSRLQSMMMYLVAQSEVSSKPPPTTPTAMQTVPSHTQHTPPTRQPSQPKSSPKSTVAFVEASSSNPATDNSPRYDDGMSESDGDTVFLVSMDRQKRSSHHGNNSDLELLESFDKFFQPPLVPVDSNLDNDIPSPSFNLGSPTSLEGGSVSIDANLVSPVSDTFHSEVTLMSTSDDCHGKDAAKCDGDCSSVGDSSSLASEPIGIYPIRGSGSGRQMKSVKSFSTSSRFSEPISIFSEIIITENSKF